MPDLILVIDLGTQSMRGTAVDREGRAWFSVSHPIATDRDGPRCEQDPLVWRASLLSILDAARDAVGPRIAAIVATGTLSGLVFLDESGQPLRPAIMYGDQRARPQAERIRQSDRLRESGWRVHSGDFLPQMLYVAQAERDLYERTKWVVDATGYLNFLLTGEATMDAFTRFHCYAEPDQRRLPLELFADLDLDGRKVGKLLALGEVAGTSNGVPVFAASFDSICGYAGAGLCKEGDALDISGTVTSFGVRHRRRVVDAERRIYSLPWMPEGEWLVRGSTAMSGGVLEWARREIVQGDFTEFDRLVSASKPGANGVLFLPYLAGERAPIWSESATGVFFGMTPNTTRADLARAVYEGLCYALRHIQTVIAEQGVPIGTVKLAGGLARNPLLTRIKADITGRVLRQLGDAELTTLGCVAIAGTSLGWYASIAEGANALLVEAGEVEPAGDARYDEAFASYMALSKALLPLFG